MATLPQNSSVKKSVEITMNVMEDHIGRMMGPSCFFQCSCEISDVIPRAATTKEASHDYWKNSSSFQYPGEPLLSHSLDNLPNMCREDDRTKLTNSVR